MMPGALEATRAEAEAFFDEFVAYGERSLPWFVGEIKQRAGLDADGSVASLDPIFGWVLDRLGNADGVSVPATLGPPPWWTQRHVEQRGWSTYDAALVDGLIRYVAEIYRRELDVEWELPDEQEPIDLFYNTPQLSPPATAPPWVQVLNSMDRVTEVGKDRTVLRSAVERTLQDGRRSGRRYRPQPMPPRVDVTAIKDPHWHFHVWLDEGAEYDLGTEAFMGLWERFENLSGVVEVSHMDREVFLVRVQTEWRRVRQRPVVDAAELQTAFQRIIDGLWQQHQYDKKQQNHDESK